MTLHENNSVPYRTILLFPNLTNLDIVQRLRSLYDPLAHLIRPHITVAFPFKSEITNQELDGLLEKKLKHFSSFPLKLQGFSSHSDSFGNYLFLNVIQGKEQLLELHNLVYSGPLKEFSPKQPYTPHMTIGRLSTPNQMASALENVKEITTSFDTIVDTLSVEMIGENEESIILLEKKLHRRLSD